MSRNSVLIIALLALMAIPLYAQQSKPLIPDTTTCQSTFSTGSGLTYLSFCVTANGNVLLLTSPQGYQMFGGGEGYSLCDSGTSNLYWDYAAYGDNAAWGAPVVTQPKGANTFPLTIKRTTVDGIFTLTQKFTWNTAEHIVAISMTVKNNLAVSKSVYLTRMVDADIDNCSNGCQSYFMSNDQTDMAWGTGVPAPDPYALMLYTTTPAIAHVATFNAYSTGILANACNIPINQTQGFFFDAVFYLTHNFSLPARASKIVNVEYKRY